MTESFPLDSVTEKLREFCKDNHIQELAVFGSSLTDKFHEESDIDLLVTFEPEAKIGFLTMARIQRELSEIVGREVDLVPKRGLKPVIRDAVLASAKVLYAA